MKPQTEKEKEALAIKVLSNHYDDDAIKEIMRIRKENKKKANVNQN